jgi:anti-sigma factor RsiW
MDEHERMLAEGPRVAPEPGAADDTGKRVVPQQSKGTPSWLRVLPAVAVAVFVAATAIFGGGRNWGWAVFVVLAIALQLLRRRKR